MLRANYCPGYFRRFLFVSLGCLAYASWCLYDGFIAYPQQMTMAAVYYELPEENRTELWREQAKENGWSYEKPKTQEKLQHLIGQQWFMAGLCALIGIPAFWKYFSAKGTWVEGDATMIRNSKGQQVPIDQITKINKRKWREKGLATIYYQDGGKAKKFVMDDFKYDREPMGELMRFAEAGLADDQVIGGPKEVDMVPASSESENPA